MGEKYSLKIIQQGKTLQVRTIQNGACMTVELLLFRPQMLRVFSWLTLSLWYPRQAATQAGGRCSAPRLANNISVIVN
jgi:hypothetical protein